MSIRKLTKKQVRLYHLKCKQSKAKKKGKKKRKKGVKAGNSSKKTNKEQNDPQNISPPYEITVQKTKAACRRYEEFHDHFLNYDQIVNFLEKTQKCNPGAVDVINVGSSAQGKPIYMVLITTDSTNSTGPKFAAFIQAGLKGEDTFAVSNALYIIDYLSKNPCYITIMDYLIIPCVNPDAYDMFVKNKAKDKKTCGIKRAGSDYCNVEEKKSRGQSPKNKKRDLNIPSGPCSRNAMMEAANNDWFRRILRSTFSKSNKNKNKKENPCKPSDVNKQSNKTIKNNSKINPKESKACTNLCTEKWDNENSIPMDLTLNFPVVLGLNDMSKIPTDCFLEKIKIWKEKYVSSSPETFALVRAINSYQFAIKLLISLQEEGEAICYPYGFSAATNEETDDLKQVAKKGKCAITNRNFQFGSLYDIQGLTYGNLVDFLKVDRSSIKYTYTIKVHKKTPKYNEAQELQHLMTYGCEVMECIKRMSTAVFKFYTNMTGNKQVETARTKHGLDKRSNF